MSEQARIADQHAAAEQVDTSRGPDASVST
jgi:hypothetical protein